MARSTPSNAFIRLDLPTFGPPNDAYPDALANQSTPLVTVDEQRNSLDDPNDVPGQLLALKQLDFFLRKVYRRLHLYEGIHQLFPQRLHLPGQAALHLAQCHTDGLVRAGSDQVQHGLGLRQIQSSIQESSFGKLPGLSMPCPARQRQAKHLPYHEGASVAVDLHGVLSRIASRPLEKGEHHLVHERAPSRIPNLAVIQPVRFPSDIRATEHLPADVLGIRTAQTHYGHTPLPPGA